MSERIDEILEVLKIAHMLRGATTEDGRSLASRDIRHLAVSLVAKARGIDSTTVSDKFRRQLHPHIAGTAAFDDALSAWLYERSPSLENALLLHTVSDADRARIQSFFAARTATVVISAPAT